jgi:hypothetical protein
LRAAGREFRAARREFRAAARGPRPFHIVFYLGDFPDSIFSRDW